MFDRLDNTYVLLPEKYYSKVEVNRAPNPEMMIFNEKMAADMKIDSDYFKSEEGLKVLVGNIYPKNSAQIAMAYCGHQFGYFNMLGDGRAALIGELPIEEKAITGNGPINRVDIQLKGSGVTEYSRRGDGKAAVGPMMREYIMSEAMYHLGIPTTRTLSVVSTGDSVPRQKILPGAVLARVSESHIRVGTFQYSATYCSIDEQIKFADYVLKRQFPLLYEDMNKNVSKYGDNVDRMTEKNGFQEEKTEESCKTVDKSKYYIKMLREVVKKQASLIAKWQLAGFIHGVMNTDNMTISGETIDYGPCAFMDIYNPKTVFSSIDYNGRYAYINQPPIAKWNLMRLGESLIGIVDDREEEAIKKIINEINRFDLEYIREYRMGMFKKLGMMKFDDLSVESEEDELKGNAVSGELLSLMNKYESDYTNTFAALTLSMSEDEEEKEFFKWIVENGGIKRLFSSEEFLKWHKIWVSRTTEDAYLTMKKSNPYVIPRNHQVQKAIDKAEKYKSMKLSKKLLSVLEKPFDYNFEHKKYMLLPDESEEVKVTYCGT